MYNQSIHPVKYKDIGGTMTAIETLEKLRLDLLKTSKNFELTKEQEEQFEFIKDRLTDGEQAETALLEIDIIIGKSRGEI